MRGLRLEADQVLDGLDDRLPHAFQEELAGERRTVEGAAGQDHGRSFSRVVRKASVGSGPERAGPRAAFTRRTAQ
ncbi:hypothetical protein GCM10009678_42280 [Actinomadura kijaniata]